MSSQSYFSVVLAAATAVNFDDSNLPHTGRVSLGYVKSQANILTGPLTIQTIWVPWNQQISTILETQSHTHKRNTALRIHPTASLFPKTSDNLCYISLAHLCCGQLHTSTDSCWYLNIPTFQVRSLLQNPRCPCKHVNAYLSTSQKGKRRIAPIGNSQ